MNWSAPFVGLVPLALLTFTSTVPLPAGEVALIEVELTTSTFVAALAPKLTVLPLINPVPVIVTRLPPAAGPELGLTPDTVGAGGAGAL